MRNVLGYPVTQYPRSQDMKTERQVLVEIFGEEGEVEVTGLEYWYDDGDKRRWNTCKSQYLPFVCFL